MKRRRAKTVLLGLLAVALIAAPAQAQKIETLGAEPLTVNAKTGEFTAEEQLALFNPGKPVEVDVTLEAKSSTDFALSPTPTHARLETGANAVKVTLDGLTRLKTKQTGYLVVTGGDAPIAKPVSVTPAPQGSRDWAEWIFELCVAFFGGLLAVVLLGLLARKKLGLLWKRAVSPKWERDSWATTLTSAGGLLAIVVGQVTLPEVPRRIDKDTLIALNLLFAVMLFAGPFLFNVIRAPGGDAGDKEAGLTGFHFVLLISLCLTGAAVLGQIVTLGLLGSELTEGGWNTAVVVATGILVVLCVVYFLTTTFVIAGRDWEAESAKAAQDAKDEKRRAQRVVVIKDIPRAKSEGQDLDARSLAQEQNDDDVSEPEPRRERVTLAMP